MAPDPPSARFEFPIMLYGMLEECTFDDDLSQIVSWQPHGLSFKIQDRESFEKILPQWFKEKYESFRCLLEQWGFIKLSRGKERGCWYHVNFGHGRKTKLQNIAKDDFLKGMPEYLSPREEPDLYKKATAESSISEKKERLKTLRDHTAVDSLGSLPSSSKLFGSNKRSREADETSTENSGPPPKKRIRENDDVSMTNSVPPPLRKEKKPKQVKSKPNRPPLPAYQPDGGGCKVCGRDDDHSNLLLCEGCEVESHTYCLDPPLDAVPEDDWFCAKCSKRISKDRKELTKLIKTVPEEMRSRFGEVCFSKNSSGSQWWPAMIFEPRSFLQNRDVVELCKRNLGKRNLVFYFENQEAFAAVPDSWIVTWEEGVMKEYDKGKPVRTASKQRQEQYQQALEAARLAMLGSADVDSKHSESTQEESFVSQPEATPASALKEVEDDTVLCSKCGRTVDVSLGPVLQDGYWYCHQCIKVPIPPVPKAPAPARSAPPPPSRSLLPKPINNANTAAAKLAADQNWLSARDHAITTVGGNDATQVEIDDEILKGITQRPSGKWQAQVYYAGKSRYIGVFPNRQKAALAFKLVRSKLRPQKRNAARKDVQARVNGALKESFSNLFGNSVSASQIERRVTAFTEKKPKSHPSETAAVNVASSISNTSRYIDNEKTKVLLETSLCRYYCDIP
ncbi:MAG: hypothetical protein SGILL_002915, partial [Bacillariaceae sp.]